MAGIRQLFGTERFDGIFRAMCSWSVVIVCYSQKCSSCLRKLMAKHHPF